MARVKRAVNAQKKRRTILKASKGYRGQRSRLYRKAKEQQLHSLNYAYRDRRARKGEFRKLWISRINAAARANDITYNRLIQGLKAAGVEVDRKNLAEIAVSDPAAFTALVEVAKAALPEDVNAPRPERPPEPRSPSARRAWWPRRSCIATSVANGRDGSSPRDRISSRPRCPRRGAGGVRHRIGRGAVRHVARWRRRARPPGHRPCRESPVGHRDAGRPGGGLRTRTVDAWTTSSPRGPDRSSSRSASPSPVTPAR